MKTMIGIPCGEMMPVKFVSCLMGLNRVGQTHVNFNIGSLVYDNRNQLVVDAIQNKADMILWIDSDMTFEPDMLQRFLADMEENPDIDILCGIFFRRRTDTSPVIYSRIEPPEFTDTTVKQNIEVFTHYPRNDLFPICGCGFGAVLTKTSVCKAVWDKYGPPFAPTHWAGEDIMFCYRARQLGFNIWCDSRVKVGHIGQFVYDEKYWESLGGEQNAKI